MRNLKKILAMALTVLMVVGSFAMTATAAFDDVTDYQEAIEVMAALGIAAGKSETEFAPDDDVTREEMALWIAKIMTGKVAADYVTNNFLGAVENLTAFADLDEDNYVGAINYATNNGIIVGTSATTFEPAEAIKIQDVFAMVVRMLGYGSTAMNNNYPWSFIDKAISLGLDADLPADYSNEAVASRGETMQILYNALTALKSDGSTLGYDFFGLEKATVVITGTDDGNMYTGSAYVAGKTVDGEDYVAFSVLGENGVLGSNTYYALKSEFGIAAESNTNAFVGNSYVVRSIDGFVTFLTCEACESVVVDQTVVVGGTSSGSTKDYVTIDGIKYTLVKEYTTFGNNQGSKTTNDYELVLMRADGSMNEVIDYNSYVMNKDLDILAEDGSILLHWVTTFGVGAEPAYANLNGMYLYMIPGTEDDPEYVQPNDYIWSLAKKATYNASTKYGFSYIDANPTASKGSYENLELWDAYSDTVLYDDDADGVYDRGVYYQYKFGKVGLKNFYSAGTNYQQLAVNGVAVHPTEGTSYKYTNLKYYTAEGEAISYDDIAGKYVLYTYNPLYKTFIVKEILDVQTGLVTGIDLVKKTITLNAFGANIITGVVAGETYTLGNSKLSGGAYGDIYKRNNLTKTTLANTLGKNVNFVEKDGMVLEIVDAATDAKHMVYVNNNAGYTTMGYNNIVAYYNPVAGAIAATQAVVTVNAVDNYWYSGLFGNGTVIGEDFEPGALLAATKDSLGNYDVSVAAPQYTAANGDTITINNSIIYSASGNLGVWQINANTVFIVREADGTFKSYTGIPASSATITVNAKGKVYFENNANENFVYVDGGTFNYTGSAVNPWNNNVQNSTIIYVSGDTIGTMVASNAYNYGIGVTVGMSYSYSKAIDVINGGFVDSVMTDYNFNRQLEAGKFYYVENGYVTREVTVGNEIKIGKLLYADNDNVWTAKLLENNTNDKINVDADGNVIAGQITTYANAFPKVYLRESNAATAGISYSTSVLLNILDCYDDTSYASYSSTYVNIAKAAAAAYDEDDLNYALVYYYDYDATATGLYNKFSIAENAPVFIQLASDATGTLTAVEPDPDPINLGINLYGWDKNNNDSANWFKAFAEVDYINVYKSISVVDSEEIAIDLTGSIAVDDEELVTEDDGTYTFYITVKDPLVANDGEKFVLKAFWIEGVPVSAGATRLENEITVADTGLRSTKDGKAVYSVTVDSSMVYTAENKINVVLAVEHIVD